MCQSEMKVDPPDIDSYGKSSNGSKMSTLRKKETNFHKLLWNASVYVIVDRDKFLAATTPDEKYNAIVYSGYTSEKLPHERRELHREKFPKGQYEIIVVKAWKFGEVTNWFGLEGLEAFVAEFVLERLAANFNFGSTNKAGGGDKLVDDFFRVVASGPGREEQLKKSLDCALTIGKFVTAQDYRCPDESCDYRNEHKSKLVSHVQNVHKVFMRLSWCLKCTTPQSFESEAEYRHHYYMEHTKVQEMFWCLKCTIPHSFDSLAEIQAHQSAIQEVFWCRKCTPHHSFLSKAAVQAHQSAIQEVFWCRKCTPHHSFPSKAAVQAHQGATRKVFWGRQCTPNHSFDSESKANSHRQKLRRQKQKKKRWIHS